MTLRVIGLYIIYIVHAVGPCVLGLEKKLLRYRQDKYHFRFGEIPINIVREHLDRAKPHQSGETINHMLSDLGLKRQHKKVHFC